MANGAYGSEACGGPWVDEEQLERDQQQADEMADAEKQWERRELEEAWFLNAFYQDAYCERAEQGENYDE